MIDSLDECGDKIELLQWISSIAKHAVKLHLLLASRPERDVAHRLARIVRFLPVRFPSTAVKKDIGVYLDDRLDLINRWGTKTRELIKSTLLDRSDGMYVI